jgi:hypothetical protein
MSSAFYSLGKRLLISKNRRQVRGSVIFVLTYLLLFACVAFAAELLLLMLGVWGIHVPFVGQAARLLGG